MRHLCVMFLLAAVASCGYSCGDGSQTQDDSVDAQQDYALIQNVKDTMKRASTFLRSISTNGGYVGIYSLDLKERYGEAIYEKANPDEIWVQPPGTPTVGQCFLRAYKLTGDNEYLTASREVGLALAWGQRSEGGWDHRVNVSHLKEDAEKPERKSGRCTFDDRITQGAMTFLIDLDDVIDEEWLTESIELGLNFMLESQFENGAWPQWYPLRGGYNDYYTFNDNTINDCIRFMINAYKTYGVEEYRASALRGGDFIILSQLAKPQAGWAQQYDHDMKPAWARAFEPPAVCSAVTVRNIRTLVDIYLYTGNEKYLEPIPAALEWLENSKLRENLWARMYELDTNKPIYGDRDWKIHYTLEEISEERRTGYGWQGGSGVAGATSYYNEVRKSGAEEFKEKSQQPPLTAEQRKRRLEILRPAAREIISVLDDKGRWVNQRDNMIHSGDFVRNFNRLCDYLEVTEK